MHLYIWIIFYLYNYNKWGGDTKEGSNILDVNVVYNGVLEGKE